MAQAGRGAPAYRPGGCGSALPCRPTYVGGGSRADRPTRAAAVHARRLEVGLRSRLGMRSWAARLSILLCPVLVAGSAAAQTAEEIQASRRPRGRLMEIGYLNLNAMYPTVGHALSQRVRPQVYGETAEFDFRHVTPSRVGVDAAVGLRVWSNLAVGLGVTHSSAPTDVDVTGRVPHPLFYERPRELMDRLGRFYRRTELGIHLHAAWTIPLADRLDVVLSAGPSLFFVEFDRVDPPDQSDVNEMTPYTVEQLTVDFGRGSVQKRVPGASVGVDLTYHFIRRSDPGALFWTAGIGIFAGWMTGTSALPEFGADENLDVGGLRAGAGLRFRF